MVHFAITEVFCIPELYVLQLKTEKIELKRLFSIFFSILI